MSHSSPSAAVEPAAAVQPRPGAQPVPRRQPPYHVVLHDDNDHTYEYVIEMLARLFGHPVERGFRLAKEVDSVGRAIVETTTLERAELKRDQIHAFGRDRRLPRCAGSMRASLEPAVSS